MRKETRSPQLGFLGLSRPLGLDYETTTQSRAFQIHTMEPQLPKWRCLATSGGAVGFFHSWGCCWLFTGQKQSSLPLPTQHTQQTAEVTRRQGPPSVVGSGVAAKMASGS